MAGRDLPAAMTRDQQFMAAIVDGLDEVAGLLRGRLPEPAPPAEARAGTVKVSEPGAAPAEPDAVEPPALPATKKTTPRTRRKPTTRT